MADNDEKGDHLEPATLVERAASAGVDVGAGRAPPADSRKR